MPITLLPRPSLAGSVVIAASIAGGLAVGAAGACALLLAARLGRS